MSKKPNKIAYKSYDTELDLSGGYLTITSGSKIGYVNLTKDMATGFDPTAVTAENPVDTQTITIT